MASMRAVGVRRKVPRRCPCGSPHAVWGQQSVKPDGKASVRGQGIRPASGGFRLHGGCAVPAILRRRGCAHGQPGSPLGLAIASDPVEGLHEY
jgi:hypothetical protein